MTAHKRKTFVEVIYPFPTHEPKKKKDPAKISSLFCTNEKKILVSAYLISN